MPAHFLKSTSHIKTSFLMSPNPSFQRRLLVAWAASISLLLPGMVSAHEGHNKPQHGGQVAEAGAFQGELVVKGRNLVLHVTDHGAPVAMAGGSAKAVLLIGSEKSELTFVVASSNQLTATAPATLMAGAKVVVTVKLPNGRSGNLRFELR